MSFMTIPEVEREKLRLESMMLALIETFEGKTGGIVVVEIINVIRKEYDEDEPLKVDIKLELNFVPKEDNDAE